MRFAAMEYFQSLGMDCYDRGKNVSRGWLGIRCPFPSCSDRSNHCGITPDRQRYYCHICKSKGSIEDLIMQIESCDYGAAEAIVARFREDKGAPDFSQGRGLKPPIHGSYKAGVLPELLLPQLPKSYIDFLIKRRFDPDTIINMYKVKVASLAEYKWKYRLLIPFFVKGRIVTFTGRDITGKSDVPYKHLSIADSIIDPKRTLYNIDRVKMRGAAAIVEGVFDAWRIGDGAVGTMGTTMEPEQILTLLSREPKRVVVALDAGAEKESKKIANDLTAYIPEVYQVIIERGDPDELPERDLTKIRRYLQKTIP